MEDRRMQKLYELLEKSQLEHDTDTEAALRWAIFTLENLSVLSYS